MIDRPIHLFRTIALCLAGCLGIGAHCADARDTDQDYLIQLIDLHAEDVLDRLVEEGAKVVGVLKFDVRDRRSYNTLGLQCADWLETAMRRANHGRLQFVQDASQVASGISGADHSKSSGRSRLFESLYPMENGSKVKVDAFVTGRIFVRDDLASVDVTIQSVHGGPNPRTEKLVRFNANTKQGVLAALGAPFHIREGEDASDAAANAADAMEHPRDARDQRSKQLIKFDVLYDDKPVSVQGGDGFLWIPEPTEGQRVTIRMKRIDQSDRTLGVVVKVNGISVYSGRRVADFAALKYILEPESEIVIRGFQQSGDRQQAAAFEIASRSRSRELESLYGADVGTISFTIFKQAETFDEKNDYFVNLAQGVVQVDQKAVQKPKELLVEKRGLVVAGEKQVAQPTREVPRKQWDPNPVLAEVIHYYKPSGE